MGRGRSGRGGVVYNEVGEGLSRLRRFKLGWKEKRRPDCCKSGGREWGCRPKERERTGEGGGGGRGGKEREERPREGGQNGAAKENSQKHFSHEYS